MKIDVLCVLAALLTAAMTSAVYAADSIDDLLKNARAAFQNGNPEQALALAGKAIEAAPNNPTPWLFRGVLQETMQKHAQAVADFDKVIALDPKNAEAYNRRGSEHFKLGQLEQSIADFDQHIKLKPQDEPGHWQRGISYYYAGKYAEGAKQFEGYEQVDANDVENAVWRYLCMAKKDGVEKARKEILKIGNDRRPWAMQVYALFCDKAKPADVLDAARAGDPPAKELNERLFYAHLYLGLYFDAAGDKAKALEHMTTAAEKHKIGHYMWDVAHVHLQLLRKEGKK